MEYDAVLFDNDGVLTTLTEWEVLYDAIEEAAESVGVTDPDTAAVESLMDTTVEDVRTIATQHGVDPATLWERRDRTAAEKQIAAVEAGRKRLYDDVDAVDRLPVPQGIVSNNQDRTVEFIASYFDLDWAEVVYGREPTLDGIRRKKPNTHYIEAAMAGLGVDPDGDRILYVGDSSKDLTAARRADIDAAFVRREHRADETLPYDPAYEVEDLRTLVDRLLDEDGPA